MKDKFWNVALLIAILCIPLVIFFGGNEKDVHNPNVRVEKRFENEMTYYADGVIGLNNVDTGEMRFLYPDNEDDAFIPGYRMIQSDGETILHQYRWVARHNEDVHVIPVTVTTYAEDTVRFDFPQFEIELAAGVSEDLPLEEMEEFAREEHEFEGMKVILDLSFEQVDTAPEGVAAFNFGPAPNDYVGTLFEGSHICSQYLSGHRS